MFDSLAALLGKLCQWPSRTAGSTSIINLQGHLEGYQGKGEAAALKLVNKLSFGL